MYIKTTKPTDESGELNDLKSIVNYIENLKEEISFRLETIHKKTDYLQSVVNEMRGESQ